MGIMLIHNNCIFRKQKSFFPQNVWWTFEMRPFPSFYNLPLTQNLIVEFELAEFYV